MYIFRKRDSDAPEVILTRRQQDALAKAAKRCCKERRQQEAQAMAAKRQSEPHQQSQGSLVPTPESQPIFQLKTSEPVWAKH